MLDLRPAAPADADEIAAMIAELADYEQLAHQMSARPEDLARTLFGPAPRAYCDIAAWSGRPVGFAVWFYNFSTFEGRHGIYLEDVYVRPEARRRGVATGLLAGLAQRCRAEALTRLEWRMLAWNAPAERFFESLGTSTTADWRFGRMDTAALVRVAALGGPSSHTPAN